VELLLHITTLNGLLPLLAIIAGIFVISTKNAIISVFNLIVLYILVAFYLIYIGVTYLGISYIIIYIGAIAILFLFIIMMIDVEVVEKRSNNYLPLLFLFLSGFLLSLKKILHNIGLIKMRSLSFKEEKIVINESQLDLYSIVEPVFINNINNIIYNNIDVENNFDIKKDINNNKEDYNSESINETYGNFHSSNYENENFHTLVKDNSDKLTLWIDNLCTEFQNKIPWNGDYINLFQETDEKINIIRAMDYNKFFPQREYQDSVTLINSEKNYDINIIDSKFTNISNYVINSENHYLLIAPNWDSVVNRITQITAIGDVLYTVYHSYIYIVSVILLLGMVGAIILTADNYQQIRILKISRYKNSSFLSFNYLINLMYELKLIIKKLWSFIIYKYRNNSNFILKKKYTFFFNVINFEDKNYYKKYKNTFNYIYTKYNNKWKINKLKNKGRQRYLGLFSYCHNLQSDYSHSEKIIGNLSYFIIAIVLVAFLLLSINSYLSLSIKYLEKGGGFECGFTSFLQTRERYNIYFYRVSLLFLVFDLEIILAFPYTTIYQKNQNMSKNNVLAFLFLLIVGFIFELKEGALNIVKKAHSTEINIKN
jgi:NADH:ubiquinone oxidoreductase subunit 6 (subunit J)/NADH:ubiquinone oxidoreductase subunit 3 (subunit A)